MQKHYNYLNIDLDKKIHTKLKAKQGDSKSRYILVNLISNSTYYDLSDCAVDIYGIKKDKTIFFNHATVTNAKQGQFEVELTTQALAVPGEVEIQILILGTNDEKLTTFSFFIDVKKTIIDDAAIESTNEFTALTEALSSVQNIDNRFREVDEQFNTIGSEISKPISLNKCDSEMLGAIQNKEGETTFNLLSIPRDYSVNAIKTTFLENRNKNLFDGVFLEGYIQDTGVGNRYTTSLNGKTVAVNVSPNTTYSINKSSLSLDNGYYYFKLISFTKTKEEVLSNMSSGWTTVADGSVVLIDASATSQRLNYTFTTGSNDKSIFIVVARTLTPYVEVFEGNFNTLQYSSYDEEDNILKNTKINEIDVIKSGTNFISKTGNIINITLNNKIKYTFEKKTDDTIKLNTWMLTYSGINNKDLWIATDIEAPIKEKGASDFIGGVHGDEVFESIEILIDGRILDLNNNYNKLNFNNLTIFVKSTLNHCDTTNPAFTRYKKLEFMDNELIVSNRLICLSNFIVERYTGCGLYSVYKDNLIGYSTNTTNNLVKSGGQSLNKNMDTGYFYGNDFTIKIKTISGKTDNYGGFVQDFYNESRPRYKFYLDTINSSSGVLISVGEELNTSFSIKII